LYRSQNLVLSAACVQFTAAIILIDYISIALQVQMRESKVQAAGHWPDQVWMLVDRRAVTA
jgi:hypothetical protein